MKKTTRWGINSGVGLGVACMAFFAGRAIAGGAPSTRPLVYSGLLQNADGTPFSATGHNINIKLWDSATAGNPLCDTQPQTLTTDATGRFSLPLVDPANDCVKAIGAHPDTYVEILLDGAVLGGNRSRLGAVPYAIEANHALSADVAGAATSASVATGALEARIAALESAKGTLNGNAPADASHCANGSTSGLESASICMKGIHVPVDSVLTVSVVGVWYTTGGKTCDLGVAVDHKLLGSTEDGSQSYQTETFSTVAIPIGYSAATEIAAGDHTLEIQFVSRDATSTCSVSGTSLSWSLIPR